MTWGLPAGPGYRKVDYDVYVAADVPHTPLTRLRALLARGGPGAVATGWSACTALGLDVASRPHPVEIVAPATRLEPVPGTVVRRGRVDRDEITLHDGLSTTTPLRTAFDLARRSGPHAAAVDRVIDPLTEAVVAADALARRGGFAGPDLEECASRHRGMRGVTHVGRVAALLDPRLDSPPESRLRVTLVLAGLPAPQVRFVVRDPFGVRLHEVDLAWPQYRVAVEYDGHDHAQADRRGRDVDRLETLRREGWEVIVVTAVQLRRARWVVDRASAVLTARGWRPGPNPWAAVVAENAALMHRMP